MKRMIVTWIGFFLISGPASASNRLVVKKEWYYTANPEIVRAVHQISLQTAKARDSLEQPRQADTKAYWAARFREDPDLARAPHQTLQQASQESGEEIDWAAASGETAGMAASGTSASSSELQGRLQALEIEDRRLQHDRDVQLFAAFERTTPYLALECVVGQGHIEAADALLNERPVTIRVGLSHFEGATPLVLPEPT